MRIILIRGLGRDQLHWAPLLKSLKRTFPGVHIETPDLPGTGILHREKSPLVLDDYLPFLEHQLSDSNEPAIVMGLSLGGMLALTWASKYPDKFTHAIAINSSSNLSFFLKRLFVYKVFRYPGIFFRLSKRMKETAVYQLTCNTRPIDWSTIDFWVDVQKRHPVSPLNQCRQAYAALGFSLPDNLVSSADNLKENKTHSPQAAIMYAKGDRMVSPSCSEVMAAYLNAPSYVHSWGGHDLTQDDPDWVATQLKHFIEKTSDDSIA